MGVTIAQDEWVEWLVLLPRMMSGRRRISYYSFSNTMAGVFLKKRKKKKKIRVNIIFLFSFLLSFFTFSITNFSKINLPFLLLDLKEIGGN